MKKQLNITILTVLILLLGGQLTAQTSQPLSSPYLDNYIQTSMANQHIPGLSACIVKEGQIRWIGAYGMANLEQNIPVDTSTLFMLASVSKTVTVTALMQLWEEGLFNLDDDINEYLDFEVRHPVDSLVPITFRMLCTHTSSIQDNWDIMPYYWGEDPPIPLDERFFNYLSPYGSNYDSLLNFYYYDPPGTVYHYSNIGAALLGYLVEILGDSTFLHQTQQNIFEPLGMNETSWFLTDLDTMHMAKPYNWNGSVYDPWGFYSYDDYPAGSLWTSIDQLANFLLCYMNDGTYQGQEILNYETVDMILTPQVPQLSSTVCLIWHKLPYQGHLYWGHGGGDLGVTTSLYFRPEDNTGVIILANGDGDLTNMGEILFGYAADSIQANCLSEGITFTSQEEIDNFQTNYPYCTEIEGDVTISGEGISNLDGLNTLTSIGGYLWIGNNALTNLTGLNNLTSIDGSLSIGYSSPLTSLLGLENLTSIGGDLRINYTSVLADLLDLENLTAIGGSLIIVANGALTSLSGLDNVDAASIDDLSIFENNSLSFCEIQSVCDYLAAPNGTIEIHTNSTGCNTPQEVEEACDTSVIVTENTIKETFIISPNPLESTSVIKYSIPFKLPVTIKIVDLTGQKIITLVNESQHQGKKQIIFNTGHLPTGIYFCVLKTNNGMQTKKIIKL